MHTPLVSIIIPAYNSEQWIAEAVNSCLNQSYKHIEVIVVNDGSTDGTLAVVQQIDDMRLKVFSQMNMGACVARNRGFDESAGEYVKFFDADDYMYPDAIEKQLEEALKLPNNVITYGWFLINGQESLSYPKFNSSDQVTISDLKLGLMTALPLYHRDVVTKIGGFDKKMKFYQDTEIIYNCIAHGFRFQYADICIYNWLYGSNNSSIAVSTDFDFNTVYNLYSKYQPQIDASKESKRTFFTTLLQRVFIARRAYKSRKFLRWILFTCPYAVTKCKCFKGSRTLTMLLFYLSFINAEIAWTFVSKLFNLLNKSIYKDV